MGVPNQILLATALTQTQTMDEIACTHLNTDSMWKGLPKRCMNPNLEPTLRVQHARLQLSIRFSQPFGGHTRGAT